MMKNSGSPIFESASRPATSQLSASRLIDERIQELGDWRGEMISRLRALIRQSNLEVIEEWKWENPVLSHDVIICTGELKEGGQADLRRGRLPGCPRRSLQFQSRRRSEAHHRLPRRRQGEREGFESSDSRRRGVEHIQGFRCPDGIEPLPVRGMKCVIPVESESRTASKGWKAAWASGVGADFGSGFIADGRAVGGLADGV